MTEPTVLPNVVTALISAFTAAGLTTLFSLWRFRQERWWEKKFESYVAIMESLHNIAMPYDEELEASGTGAKVSDARKKELAEKLHASLNEIYKQVYTGEFLLTPDAVDALRLMLRSVDDAGVERDFVSHQDRCSKAIHACIDKMRSLAKGDLHYGRFWRQFYCLKIGICTRTTNDR